VPEAVYAYMVYVCRPDNGRYVLRNNVKLFNDMVVPYNPALLLKYNCHINVEVVSTIRAVKYLYKYILKGGTRVAVELRAPGTANRQRQPPMNVQQDADRHDEIQHHIDGRCVCQYCVHTIGIPYFPWIFGAFHGILVDVPVRSEAKPITFIFCIQSQPTLSKLSMKSTQPQHTRLTSLHNAHCILWGRCMNVVHPAVRATYKLQTITPSLILADDHLGRHDTPCEIGLGPGGCSNLGGWTLIE